MALLILGVLVALLAVVGSARRERERRLRTWAEALTPRGQSEYAVEARAIGRQMETIRETYELAETRRRDGGGQEALRLLLVACHSVEAFVSGRIAHLREVAALARAMSALLPLPPLVIGSFRRWPLRGRALLTAVIDGATLGRRRRFQRRVGFLTRGFGWVARTVRSSTNRAGQHSSHWRAIHAARADLGVLNAESLAAYRVLLASSEREAANPDEAAPN